MKLKNSKYRIVLLLLGVGACAVLILNFSTITKFGFIIQYSYLHAAPLDPNPNQNSLFYDLLASKAESRLKSKVTYDGSYLKIDYPMGDVPSNIGVCTDVVIRSYRLVGIDLQELVHGDMKDHFLRYPKIWGLMAPDTNIDHRCVPNLMTFFNRSGAALPITKDPDNYLPGNVVAWDSGDGLTHIGIVSTKISRKTGNPMIVHNIGLGPKLDDMLFGYKIIGHYRYGHLTTNSTGIAPEG